MKEVVGAVPSEIAQHLDFYESWSADQIEVEGCIRARGVEYESPSQLRNSFMDGVFWNNYGHGTPRKNSSRKK